MEHSTPPLPSGTEIQTVLLRTQPWLLEKCLCCWAGRPSRKSALWNLAKVCLLECWKTAYREVTNLEALCTTTTQDGWQGKLLASLYSSCQVLEKPLSLEELDAGKAICAAEACSREATHCKGLSSKSTGTKQQSPFPSVMCLSSLRSRKPAKRNYLKVPDLFSQSRSERWTWNWEAIIQLPVHCLSYCSISANSESNLVFSFF